MYLRSLTIKGFKSFADRSVISFEPGLSAIVGPNGSGKSNIAEAVLWVLGEQKTSNLRIQTMEELIFSGSSARDPVGVAEVELVLDNADGTLPIEYEQVAISRRMHRNGESEYYINGAPTRRMDIIDILFDSGIGHGVHSVIGQGNLTAVLESRPEDRRDLIEEAAGILKHKRRKEKSARKLDAMDASLARVNDIIQVTESQLKPLERQAARAKQYRELADELKVLELSLAVDDLRSLRVDWNLIDRNEREVQAEAELIHFRLNEREAELTKRQRILEEKGLFVGDLNEQRIRCQSIIQRLDAGMLVLEEKGKNLVSRLSDLRANLHGSIGRLGEARHEHDEISERLAEGQAQHRALAAELNELMRASEQAVKQRKLAEEGYDSLLSGQRSKQSALDSTELSLAKAQESLGALDVEEGLLNDQAKQLDSDIASTQAMLAERRGKLEHLTAALRSEQAESKQAKAEVDKRVRLQSDRQKQLLGLREQMSAIQAETRALEEVDRAFESASPALNWIKQQSGRFSGIVSQVSESLKVKSGADLPHGLSTAQLEALVERLLGTDLYGLLVQDASAARLIAEALINESSEKGEISLLPIEHSRPLAGAAKSGTRLFDLLEYPPGQAAAIEAMIGDVYLVGSLGEAQKYQLRDQSGARFATPAGAVVWPNGKVTVGVQLSNIDSVLERRRRQESLAVELKASAVQVSEAEIELSHADKNLEAAQAADLELSQSLAKQSGDSDALREEVGRVEESLSQLLYKKEGMESRLADVAARRLASLPLTGEFEKRISELKAQLEAGEGLVAEAKEQLDRAQAERLGTGERLAEGRLRFESASGTAQFLDTRQTALAKEIGTLEQNIEVYSQSERSLDIIRHRVDPLYQLYKDLHGGASVWAEKLRDQAQLEQSDSKNLREVITQASTAVEEARAELEAINSRLTDLRLDKVRLETEVEHAIGRITGENDTPLEDALEVASPENRSAAEDKASRLRRKIATMGAVNHVAMEEYSALKARRDYMLEQIADLEEARKSLARIERALDRKMRNLFLETFELVNRNFQEIFGILFPGGFGQLLLTEGDADDSNGIEVSAQPRGKKITKLSLMSGGEKSLTALALLFAIYRIRSVPFYILDEVEAALDDSNLSRLIEYFNSIRDHTQLILVTHQRRTMEAADILYGVSMQAAGVSKLVSQRLDQALRFAEDIAADAGPAAVGQTDPTDRGPTDRGKGGF